MSSCHFALIPAIAALCSDSISSSIQIIAMSSINLLNPKAEYMRKQQAMAVQLTAATGMQEVLKTNLGI